MIARMRVGIRKKMIDATKMKKMTIDKFNEVGKVEITTKMIINTMMTPEIMINKINQNTTKMKIMYVAHLMPDEMIVSRLGEEREVEEEEM